MQIVIEKATNRAVLMFADGDELALNESCLAAPDLTVSDVSSATHDIVIGDAPVSPLYWVAGALAYDSAWSIHDQATYDAFKDQAKAEYDKAIQEAMAALQAEIVQAAQQRLDDFARTRNYDDIKSACDYAGCSVQKFSIEGQYCKDKRAETWAKLYEILAEVEAGTRPIPTGFADVEPDLPGLVWPTQPE